MTIEDKIMRYFTAGISYATGTVICISGILYITNAIKSELSLENIIRIFTGIGAIAISFYIFKLKSL